MTRHVVTVFVALCMPSSAIAQDPHQVVVSDELNNGVVPLLLRIPAKLIAKSVNRDFEHMGAVNQVLLGTSSVGTSHCKGKVACIVENNPAGVSILCNISGTVESRTCGTNGPAIIDSVAITNYVAIKRMTFDGKLFTSTPASVTSCTVLKINGIKSKLPRLVGRFVIRIASARANETKEQVEGIIKLQTDEELCQRIDADFEVRIADLNKQFASSLAILKYVPGSSKTLRFRSRADGVELAVGHPLQSQTDSKESQPPISESVEVWFMQNENLVANRPMATILFSKVPTWLSTYLSDNPLFQTPDDRKWGFELDEKWIILKLHE